VRNVKFVHPVKGQWTRPHYHYIHKGVLAQASTYSPQEVRSPPNDIDNEGHVRQGDRRGSWQDTIRARGMWDR
jgi:hypothetical protein